MNTLLKSTDLDWVTIRGSTETDTSWLILTSRRGSGPIPLQVRRLEVEKRRRHVGNEVPIDLNVVRGLCVRTSQSTQMELPLCFRVQHKAFWHIVLIGECSGK